MSALAVRGCFVTGTDSEVGKTRISAALLRWLAARSQRCAGYKPVAAGTDIIDGIRVNEDVRALRDASSVPLSHAKVGCYQFEAACAPHIAAALEGRTIDRRVLLQGGRALLALADFQVVEGVGGFCVPLGPNFDSADLAARIGLPMVLVVGMRLGCINHALLTAEAIRARGLRLAGWVANTLDPAMPYLQDNILTLQHELDRRHQTPCLGVIPRLTNADPDSVRAYFHDEALRTLFGLAEASA